VNPCARTVAIAALSPAAEDGCEVNAGSVAVRVVRASVPPLAAGGVVVVAGGLAVVLVAGALGACCEVLPTPVLLVPDPHAESATALAPRASNPSHRIG